MLAEHSPGEMAEALTEGDRAQLAEAPDPDPKLTNRDLLDRIHAQLAYLVDLLAPHGQVKRDLDIVSAAFGVDGPLWGRLDHADIQAHAIQAQLDQVNERLARVDRFIADNEDLIERGKKMMGATDAMRAAMPLPGRRRHGKQ
jgi:hypothetical protein